LYSILAISEGGEAVISELRNQFNQRFTAEQYTSLLSWLEGRCGVKVGFRISETPIFVPAELLDAMAVAGAELAHALMGRADYLEAAEGAIPPDYRVAGQTGRPHFLTADFALVGARNAELEPRLVEIQAFPSVYAFQPLLGAGYQENFGLDDSLGMFLSGLTEAQYWKLLGRTILGSHSPENVVLAEVDPQNQKTLPDFELTARRLGITVVDIAKLKPVADKLHYRSAGGKLIPIHRIYNRAIADELIGRNIQLPFDLTRPWEVEWAGHPNWYFLISKFSLPWLCRAPYRFRVVPPAVFLQDFLEGSGRAELEEAGVAFPRHTTPDTVYPELLLKPLFSFAGKGIQFGPSRADLEAIPAAARGEFLLQQRMNFVPNIETPHGLTQAEIRILYLWPDDGVLTPALSLIRLGRGKMMGVDHNKNQEWVGASAAFFPARSQTPC
jgi:hypothetical protein